MTAVANVIRARPRKGRFDNQRYRELLAKTLPKVIKTEAENERYLEIVYQLMREGDDLSPEELSLLELLSILIEQYEEKTYPMADVPPDRMIRHLMEQRDLSQSDLLPVLGSRGVTSEVVNGKRKPSKKQAKALAEFFHVSTDLFLD
jgi:HTH-type transcriptional regulator / antitoxin HigA